jgi:hypothetical protein
MTACADGHLFCLDCAKRNAETTVGNGRYIFRCMDVSGCKAEFTATEITRFVDEKTVMLRDKLQSGDAIREVRSKWILANLGFNREFRDLSFLRLWSDCGE